MLVKLITARKVNLGDIRKLMSIENKSKPLLSSHKHAYKSELLIDRKTY